MSTDLVKQELERREKEELERRARDNSGSDLVKEELRRREGAAMQMRLRGGFTPAGVVPPENNELTRQGMLGVGRAGAFGARGYTFGLTDYAGSGLQKLGAEAVDLARGTDEARPYGQYLGEIKDRVAEEREKGGFWTTTAPEMAGAVFGAPGRYIAKKVTQGAQRLLPSVGGRYLGYTGTGLTFGALEKAGMGRPEDIFHNLKSGAGWGALFGAAVPAGIEVTARAGNATIGTLWRSMPERTKIVAVQRIQQSLRDAGVNLDALSIFSRLNKIGDDAVLADMGVAPQRLGATTAKQPGPAGQQAREVLGDRNLTLGQKTQDSIEKHISPSDYIGRMGDLGQQRSRAATPLYEEAKVAFGGNLAGPTNARIVISESGLPREVITEAQARLTKNAAYMKDSKSPLGKLMKAAHEQGVKEARSEAEAAGRAFDQSAYDGGLLYWDSIKRGMDSFIKNGESGIMNRSQEYTAFGRNVITLRDNLVDALDTMTTIKGRSPYAEARAAWAGSSRLMDMMEEGTKFAQGLQSKRLNTIKNLNDSESEAFLAGMSEYLKTRVGTGGDLPASFAKLQNVGNTTRKQLERLLPRDRYEAFMSDLDGLLTQKATAQKILTGSDSAENIAGMLDQGALAGGTDLIEAAIQPAGVFELLRKMTRGLADPETVMPQAVRDEVMRILLSNDTKAIQQILSTASKQGVSPDGLHRILASGGRFGAVGGENYFRGDGAVAPQ